MPRTRTSAAFCPLATFESGDVTPSYFRPIPCADPDRPDRALSLAGTDVWFTHVTRLRRGSPPLVMLADDVPTRWRAALTSLRAPFMGLDMTHAHLMGILNVTPDSFSDGGQFEAADLAVARAHEVIEAGAECVDIGGESTRPGAEFVAPKEEIARTAPVIRALRAGGFAAPISIDTRKSPVAHAALKAGATMINDVSALGFDPDMADLVAQSGAPVCLMHAQGAPDNMQGNPTYDDVLLDVYDALSAQVARCEALGIERTRILVDPGIGFGKTHEHNLALMRGLSLFHGLGCGLLLGVSRKSLVGAVAREPDPERRMPGSIALALEGLRQGVQMLRVHDIRATRQAVDLWRAAR